MELAVIVEIPEGSRNECERDHELHRIRLDRMLFTSTEYPADHGFIEGTLGRDGTRSTHLSWSASRRFPDA